MPSSVHTPESLPSASPLTGKLRASAAADYIERSAAQTMLENMKRRPATNSCSTAQVKDLSLLGAQHAQRISRTPGNPLHRGRTKEQLLQKLRQIEELALNGGAQDGDADQPLTSSLLKHHSRAFPSRAASFSGQALSMGCGRSRAGSLSASWSQPIKTGDIGSEAAAQQRLVRPGGTAQLQANTLQANLRASDPMPLPSSPMLQRRLAEPAFVQSTAATATAAPGTTQGGYVNQDLQPNSTPALPPVHLYGGRPTLVSSSTLHPMQQHTASPRSTLHPLQQHTAPQQHAASPAPMHLRSMAIKALALSRKGGLSKGVGRALPTEGLVTSIVTSSSSSSSSSSSKGPSQPRYLGRLYHIHQKRHGNPPWHPRGTHLLCPLKLGSLYPLSHPLASFLTVMPLILVKMGVAATPVKYGLLG